MASLSVTKKGSAGDSEMSWRSGSFQASRTGSISNSSTWKRYTRTNPSTEPATTDRIDQRMRQRSSSRWSRKGISPRGFLFRIFGLGGIRA